MTPGLRLAGPGILHRGGPTPEMHRRLRERQRHQRALAAADCSGFAASGLSSDYWWNGVPRAQAQAARRWVRLVLLVLPHMTSAECDRFIASLDPPKREELLRRAVNGEGPGGF